MARIEQCGGAEVRLAVQSGHSEFTFDHIIGGNRDLLAQIALAKKFAREHAPFGLYGETGTGKDLVARAIFSSEKRRFASSAPPDDLSNLRAPGPNQKNQHKIDAVTSQPSIPSGITKRLGKCS